MSRSNPNATTQHFVMRTVAEAARETLVPEATIRRWIDDGHLPATRIGRTVLVNLLAVQSLRLRLPGEPEPPDGDWSALYRRDRPWLRALGVANLLAGAAGLSVFAVPASGDLRSPWWLLLCLGNLHAGSVEWRGLGRPRRTDR